ncbi:MAG: NTP transferase domain-containing protein [Ferruginibacter sp.]
MPDQTKITGLHGIVVCGGMSRRMGKDKSMLIYYDQPQCYHLYKLLLPYCEKVFISCNDLQANTIDAGYSTMIDLPAYQSIGPMAALLSAFNQYADKDLLIIGCDYPFLTSNDLEQFLNSFQRIETAAAFYNSSALLYEPLLSYYNHQSRESILNMHANNEHSLQYFLKNNHAFKFYPENLKSIESVDTEAGYIEAVKTIKHN